MPREKGKESLRDAVKRLDEKLWHQLEEVWRKAREGIHGAQVSKDGHQQGTPHCEAVETNLAALIPDDSKGDPFSATDLFVLSAAAALHDVGKAGDSPGDHGHVSMWEVRSRAIAFGLDQGQAEVVGWVVRAHNDGDLQALPPEPIPLGTIEVDLRPLAAQFKLADALHTDWRRVSRQVAEFGGRRADDNPKTRFRLRVRGWRFDDRGRIELYAVPKDWEDVAVIHTGFEMIRRELEPVVPTLQDEGLPWELVLHVDDTDLEHSAGLELAAEERIERAFVGMDHFTGADAARFKGRGDDIQTLWRRVLTRPLALLVGDSGAGKTSLIFAGLFPKLHQMRWQTVYARPFDHPDEHIIGELWRQLWEADPPADITIVETLERASKKLRDSTLLLALDQFEDVGRVPLSEMLEGLRKALVAVQARRFLNLHVLISYRADAEAVLGPLFQQVSGSDRGLPKVYLQPLSREGARAALEAGLADAQVGVRDPLLLDTIAEELEAQTLATAGIYPPYVQMVGETLCKAAREENDSILTEELYRNQGGCAGIIGRYLMQRLEEFGERKEAARKVLVALVRSTGVKGQRSLEELRAETKLDVEALGQLLHALVDKRMIRHLGGGQYEIIHDHLAKLVSQAVGSAERELKEVRELLHLRARSYSAKHVPLQSADMARFYAIRDRIAPDNDETRMLLHSCLLNQGPAWFWLRDPAQERVLALLRDALSRPIASLRRAAAQTLAQVAGREAIPDLRTMLKDSSWSVRRAAAQALAQMTGREAIPDLRTMLKDSEPYVRQAAGHALAQVAGGKAIPDLRTMLKDNSSNVRRAAAQAFAQVAGRESIPDLRPMLKDSDWNVRSAAGDALAQVANHQDFPDLQTMLEDNNWHVRRAAAQALPHAAAPEDIPMLRTMLKDDKPHIRDAAAQALGQLRAREASSDLRTLLKDSDRDVRQAAGPALAQVAGREAIPDLQIMLKDRYWNVRFAAAEALAWLAGREATPHLRTLLKDRSYRVRLAAAHALAQVPVAKPRPTS
ncbi:MAG TPA: HEAT repeat domain-containing protein [Anaerolineae bacterium]|nr:HEAT repeat domain-containing protein [Anaerolineae bacterium]